MSVIQGLLGRRGLQEIRRSRQRQEVKLRERVVTEIKEGESFQKNNIISKIKCSQAVQGDEEQCLQGATSPVNQHQLHSVLCLVTELKIPVPGDRTWKASPGAQVHQLPEKDKAPSPLTRLCTVRIKYLPQDKIEVPYSKEEE